jgi:DNA-binding NarL/FixJ family response regulator
MIDEAGPREPGDIDTRHRLRVIVAEDDPFARRMMTEALQRADIRVVGEAEDGRQAVELVLQHRPDAVLMDVVMPVVDGLAATQRIVDEIPEQIVILISRGEDDALGLASLRAGAAGFLTKDSNVNALPRAVQGAVNGEAVISRRLGMRLVERFRGRSARTSPAPPLGSPLTAREWDVLDLLEEGRSTDEIAERLVLATETVRSHIKHILRKLHVRSRHEAVAIGQRIRASGS